MNLKTLENELKKNVKISAIMMALRRYSEKIEEKIPFLEKIHFQETDITLKSDLVEITILKSAITIDNIKKIYGLIDFSRGDFCTVTQGVYEVTIISNRKYKKKIMDIIKKEKVIKVIDSLAAIGVTLPTTAVETIGYFYEIIKSLNWENINIIEIVSTFTEMTCILKEDDVPRAFKVLKELIKNYDRE